VTLGSTPVSPPLPHPVNKGMIESKRPVTMAAHSGMRAFSVALALGEKHCCFVKSLTCCSIRNWYGRVDLGSVYFVCDAGQEDEHD
jgi:hypothetical protein